MAKLYEENGVNTVNVISAGTQLSGDIVCPGDFRIDGFVKGNIKSSAKVVVGQTGVIEGDIICSAVEIEGKVKANINVTELLALKSTAQLIGNICVGKISIEPGANFTGNCKMQNGHVEYKPKVENHPEVEK